MASWTSTFLACLPSSRSLLCRPEREQREEIKKKSRGTLTTLKLGGLGAASYSSLSLSPFFFPLAGSFLFLGVLLAAPATETKKLLAALSFHWPKVRHARASLSGLGWLAGWLAINARRITLTHAHTHAHGHGHICAQCHASPCERIPA